MMTIKKRVLVLILVMVSFFTAIEQAVSFQANGSITGNKVNIRTSPSTSSKVIKQLNAGHPVYISGQSGDWFFIQTASGTKGWVLGKYVRANNNEDKGPISISVDGPNAERANNLRKEDLDSMNPLKRGR